MKTIKLQILVVISLLIFSCSSDDSNTSELSTTNIETFEDEIKNATEFQVNNQEFVIKNGNNEIFTINEIQGFGWDGMINKVDDKYIDNVQTSNSNDGCSFSIKTKDDNLFKVKSLYLFIGAGNETLLTNIKVKIIGKIKNEIVFTIEKSSGFNDSYEITSGYTFIDFSVESGEDNSNNEIDELEFISESEQADYMALDYFIFEN